MTATTALIMGGTMHPLVSPTLGGSAQNPVGQLPSYPLAEPAQVVADIVNQAMNFFVGPTGPARGGATDAGGYNVVALQTPEEFWPLYGTLDFDASVATGVANLSNCLQGRLSCKGHYFDNAPELTSDYVAFGYSQSARIASIAKRDLIDTYRNADGTWRPLVDSNGAPLHASFVVIGNPNRPNGGFLQRFNGSYISQLGITFDGATPTDSCDADGTHCRFPTADIARQYDGWADAPVRQLNLVADLNALLGIAYLHLFYDAPVTDSMYQGTTGDTSYYMVPTHLLPLLMPLQQLGVPAPILAVLDAPLRVIVEWAYDRATNPGVPTPMQPSIVADPVTGIRNLLAAIPTGLDDGLQDAGFGRPFGTARAGMFGVGDPTVPSTAPAGAGAPSSPPRPPSARPNSAAGAKPRPSAARAGSHPQSSATPNAPKRSVGGHRPRH
ncbi:PE-PPE domain-containing protein [Mycobacterium sp. DL592]|uniref:PE-PPE domain-containing protein n=1 Tax=Mycobacterium sp. DL592 TaxID=2675524 RepID=UPI001AAEB419|nr:PE-PPE domain-containing protein [Mycobacterium sp. DL592]